MPAPGAMRLNDRSEVARVASSQPSEADPKKNVRDRARGAAGCMNHFLIRPGIAPGRVHAEGGVAAGATGRPPATRVERDDHVSRPGRMPRSGRDRKPNTSRGPGPGGSDMSEQENMRIVQEMFAALGRGDVAGVLERLSDDIEWRVAGPSELPYAGVHRGRDEVARFFQTFGQAAEFEVFEPQEYLAKGEKVVVLGRERQRIKATGQRVETEWAMVFVLGDGRITKFHNYVDTHALAAAHRET